MTRDRAVENWLRGQVGPAYDALKANPSVAVTIGLFVPGWRRSTPRSDERFRRLGTSLQEKALT